MTKSKVRTFAVSQVNRQGDCKTKFKPGRYTGRTPAGAARKAFSELCRAKSIKGVCTLTVTVRETTQGSNKKEFSYKLNRHKLDKPLVMLKGTKNEFTINYQTTAKSVKLSQLPACYKPGGKSHGPMKSTHKSQKQKGSGKKKKTKSKTKKTKKVKRKRR